ncbi:MAG: hypothetical protein ACP5SH_09350 [Syntrophobacteraceae bacterium]
MDDLDLYSIDQVEDMELQDWESDGRSDFEVIEDLASIRALNEYVMDPHLDRDEGLAVEEVERRGLFLEDEGVFEERDDE